MHNVDRGHRLAWQCSYYISAAVHGGGGSVEGSGLMVIV